MAGSTATSTAVDLSRLPPPDVVEALEYETLLADLMTDLSARLPEFDAFLESDPAVKILEIVAYRELILRQRVNDAGRAVLLATAKAADLDHLAAVFGVARREQEGDEDLRRRLLLAPDAYSVAGPRLAYVFHALSAHADVLDAAATSPGPGEVVVSVLSKVGDGTASPALIAAVAAVVDADDTRPLTDLVTVASAVIVPFAIEAELTVYAGPDAGLILETAQSSVESFLLTERRVGRDVTRSSLIAALHAAGVQNVNLISPPADVVVGETGAIWPTAIEVTVAATVG